MARGKKTGGRDFQPGNPGGPGPTPTPPDLKETQKLTRVKVARLMNKYSHLSVQELRKIVQDPNTLAIDALVCSVLGTGISKGDHQRLTFLLDRLIGPVTQKVQHSGSIKTGDKSYEDLTDEELDAKIKERIKELKTDE